MAGGNTRPNTVITGINVTPLVDITLVLLIIFMVTAKLMVNHTALSVELPKAATGHDVQEIFSVVLTAGGIVQVNGTTLGAEDDLLSRARTAKASNSELRTVIKADGDVPHRRVMHVLDMLREAGVSKIAFGVTPIPTAAIIAQ